MPVWIAQRLCPYREFNEWIEFYNQDPWGPERGDLNSATIAATVANVNRSSKQKALSTKDFMPDFGKSSRVKLTDPNAQRAFFRALAAFGGQKRNA